jgi:hypothetical protein
MPSAGEVPPCQEPAASAARDRFLRLLPAVEVPVLVEETVPGVLLVNVLIEVSPGVPLVKSLIFTMFEVMIPVISAGADRLPGVLICQEPKQVVPVLCQERPLRQREQPLGDPEP